MPATVTFKVTRRWTPLYRKTTGTMPESVQQAFCGSPASSPSPRTGS